MNTLTQEAVIEARRLRLCGSTPHRTLRKMEQERHVRHLDTGMPHHEGRI